MKQRFSLECERIAELLTQKNEKYGNSFEKTADEYGSSVILLRLDDKLNRLKTLLRANDTAINTDESVLDTLTDLAGYAILAKIYLQNKK